MAKHYDIESASTSDQVVLAESFAPGTVLIEDGKSKPIGGSFNFDSKPAGHATGNGDGHLVLQPVPSEDPNDPLNWSNTRKYVNFGIIFFYALMIFTILDIGPVVWSLYVEELGITNEQLNYTFAANCAGLAVGCVFFTPFALKYGRRPIYVVSTLVTFAMAVWQAKLNTLGEMLATQVISGLSGAVSEMLVQMTVADVFFVHQRGTMNGI